MHVSLRREQELKSISIPLNHTINWWSTKNVLGQLYIKDAIIGLQKVWILECKTSKFEYLKTNTESKKNVDFKNWKTQVLQCDS